MDNVSVIALISAAAAISGIALGWLGRSRTVRQDVATDATRDARLQVDIEYIKRGIDDVRFEQRAQGARMDQLTERVTRLEESSKQAHKRLDKVEGG